MELQHVVAFNLALLAAFASPGQRCCMRCGRLSAGAIMAATWTMLALVGLDGLFRLFPWAYTTVKTVGALYLIHVAWKTWRGAREPIPPSTRPNARAFLGGVLINLANPKSVLFAAAVLAVIFPPGLAATQKAMIVTNHLMVEIAAYAAIAVVMSTSSMSRRYLRAKAWLDRITALVLGGLGIRLLLDRWLGDPRASP